MTSFQLTTKSGHNSARSIPDNETKVPDVNDLKQHLINVWAGVEDGVIDDKTDQYSTDVSLPVFESEEDILNIHHDTN